MMVAWACSPHPSHLDEMVKASYALLEEDVCDRLDAHNLILMFDVTTLEIITSLFSTLQSQGFHLSMVIGYAHDHVLAKASQVTQIAFDHECVHLYQVLLYELKHQLSETTSALHTKLNELDHDDRLTLKKYLQYHMNAILASEAMYVHRNTFNYRLNRAIESSGINIKIQPFSLLLQIYFSLETLR